MGAALAGTSTTVTSTGGTKMVTGHRLLGVHLIHNRKYSWAPCSAIFDRHQDGKLGEVVPSSDSGLVGEFLWTCLGTCGEWGFVLLVKTEPKQYSELLAKAYCLCNREARHSIRRHVL